MMRDQESREVRRFSVYLGNDGYFSFHAENHKIISGKQERAKLPMPENEYLVTTNLYFEDVLSIYSLTGYRRTNDVSKYIFASSNYYNKKQYLINFSL